MEPGEEEAASLIMPMSGRDLAAAVIVGAATGLIVWIISVALGEYLIPKFVCGGTDTGFCGTTTPFIDGIGLIAGGAIGLTGLIRQRTFRPLLVVLAATLVFGGLFQLLGSLAWYVSLLMSVMLFGLAYGLFAWISRLKIFWQSLIVTVLCIGVVRLVLFG